jgi:hypothetical protein
VRKRWPFLVAAPKHMAKKKSFRSGPRIVSDNDRYTLLIRACRHMLLPAGRRCLRRREKAKTGSSLPRWPFRRRKARRQAHASSHLHRARPRQSQPRTVPRAIVLINACCRTLTAFSQGDWPLTCANAADARSETDFFRKAFFIAGEFLSDDASRAPHRDSKAMGSWAAARRNFNFRLPTLTVPLNQVRREVT